MFNEKLLIEVLGWQSESKKEQEQIVPTLNAYLDALNLELGGKLKIENDTHGNIFVTKGETSLYPCIVSHLDQVHKYADNKTIFQNGDYLLAFDGPRQVGTGGDDLVGIFVCLELLRDFNFMKVVFFVSEEIGCIGSNACDLSFFTDCMFIGQADRKGSADFINFSNGVQLFDADFSNFVKPVLTSTNYKECVGIATDAGCLSKRNVGIACFNISCGYYNPHTSTEYVSITDVSNCYDVICVIINNADRQFLYTRPVTTYGSLPKTEKPELYTKLYAGFKKSKFYIKSDKMSYAYSRAIDYVVNLIEERDFEIDKEDIELPYIEYLLTDYMDQKEEDAKQLVAYNQSFDSTAFKPIDNKADNIKQLDLFADRLGAKCPHKDTMYDTGMQQTYCLECFNYIEEEDAYYHNSLGKGPGYY
jgi:hypothetical protein